MAIKWTQLILTAIVFMIVAQIIHTAGAIAMMGYYADPAYFSLWSKVMMSTAGPPGMDFYLLSMAGNFVIGLIFAWAYSIANKAIGDKGYMNGVKFGVFLFLLAAVPYTFMTYMILSVPTMLNLEWALESLLVYTISCVAFTKIIK